MRIKIKNFLILGIFLFAILGFAKAASAATYYVAKTGSNSNTCAQAQTASTAKLTITAGLACLSGGDTLKIRSGVYDERINADLGINIPSGLSTSQRTVITADAGAI